MSVRTSVPSREVERARSTRWARRLLGGLTLLVVAPLATAGAVAAQTGENSLQSIDPADGASLETAPEVITLSFNQEMSTDDALSLELTCDATIQDTGIPEVDDDRLIVTVDVMSPLPASSCFITWVLRDGLGETIVNGQSTFAVLRSSPTTATTTADAPTTTDAFIRQPAVQSPTATGAEPANQGSTGGALWLGRMLSTLAVLVLFGSLALISIGWPEGPEYIVTVRFLRLVWLIGVLGAILYLIAFAADFNATSFGASMNPSAWLDLKDAGWPGRGALLRFALLVAAGWVAMRPERIIDPQTAMWAWAIPGAALIAVAMSRTDGPAAIVGFLVGIVHVLAVAVWFGGAALVARVVLAGPGEEDLVHATRAFTRVSVPAMVLAAVTGVIQTIRLDGGDLFTSGHGRVLLLKVIAVAAMLAVGLAARQQVGMRLDRAHELTVPLADRFRRAFGAETAIGVVVLAFSGWALTLTPPQVDPLAGESYALEIPYNDATTGLDARVSLGPGKVGLNGLKVEVDAPPEGITALTLRFVPPQGADAFVIEQPIPLTGAGTAYLDDSEGLPFLVGGTWTLQLDAVTAGGVLTDATRTFAITDAEGNFVTVPATSLPAAPVEVSVIEQPTTTAAFATTTTTTTTTVPPEG